LLDIGGNWNMLLYTEIQSIPNMLNGWHAGHGRSGTFSASRNCAQILATWGRALSCWNMRWWRQMTATTMILRISSLYLCAFKLPFYKIPLCSLFVAYACQYHNPTTQWSTLTSENRSPTRHHTLGLMLDVLPNSLKRRWRQFMLEISSTIQLSGNSSEGHFCSQQLPSKYKTSVVLFDKTAHFRVAFYCP
jgi:hypothetical protein